MTRVNRCPLLSPSSNLKSQELYPHPQARRNLLLKRPWDPTIPHPLMNHPVPKLHPLNIQTLMCKLRQRPFQPQSFPNLNLRLTCVLHNNPCSISHMKGKDQSLRLKQGRLLRKSLCQICILPHDGLHHLLQFLERYALLPENGVFVGMGCHEMECYYYC